MNNYTLTSIYWFQNVYLCKFKFARLAINHCRSKKDVKTYSYVNDLITRFV